MNTETNSQNDQKIWILNGAEKILNFYIERYNFVRKNIVVCDDYLGPITIKKTKPIWRANLELDKRGVKVRVLTDIRSENLQYCKEILEEIKNIEMRHMDGVKGNFTIHDDREIFSIFVDRPGESIKDAIFSTHRGTVEAHLFTFENLWSQALPAHLRIKHLEEGIHPEVLKTIREPREIVEIGYNLIRSTEEEILIIFHTANGLLRQEKMGGVGLLIESALKYKTRIRILVPIDNKITSTVYRLQKIKGIQIRNIEQAMQTMMTILVVDRRYSLVVELKDDTKENSEQAIGLATYSNSKSTVLSYVSIFETLWRQSELREELTIRSQAQKDFINIAAHELRNPIQPILGLSDILQHSDTFLDSNGADKQQKEMIDIIARNARRLQRLTEDILDVTRIEGGTLRLSKQNFVLAETIREVVQDYTTSISNSNRNLVIWFNNSDSNDIKSTNILADLDRIKQVVYNLVDNAVKFTEEGTITVTTDDEDNHIIVNVKDTGRGIDSEMLPKLFTKFVTKSDRGTGLGLYICKGIVEAHDGRIWAYNNNNNNSDGLGNSNNNRGATFGFSIPIS
ncbi:MAG: HAMP domain-containing sensor histidine kinase [Nitrososphaeraceae archaeon]